MPTDLHSTSRADAALASPCTSVCRMNQATGYCDGCLRTIDEIAHWGLLDDDEKRAVLAQVETRRAQVAARAT